MATVGHASTVAVSTATRSKFLLSILRRKAFHTTIIGILSRGSLT